MNSRMPGSGNSFRRRRSITCCVLTLPSRSSIGFSEMNIEPRFCSAAPAAATAKRGAERRHRRILSTMSATFCCSASMPLNDTSGDACVPPMISPESSVGK